MEPTGWETTTTPLLTLEEADADVLKEVTPPPCQLSPQLPLQTFSGKPSRFQSPSFASLPVPQQQVASRLPKSKSLQPPLQRDSQWAVRCLVGIKAADRSFKQTKKKLTSVGKCFPHHNCKITIAEKVKKTSRQCVFCAWQLFASK